MKFEYEGIIKKKTILLVSSCLLGGVSASANCLCTFTLQSLLSLRLSTLRRPENHASPLDTQNGDFRTSDGKITLEMDSARSIWWSSIVENYIGIVLCLSEPQKQ